jgi:Domain of unknown function (DUF5134)
VAGPSWLAYTFASVMIVTSAYCLCRLVISRRQHRPTDHGVDAVHVLMGVAMAGMLVPRLRVFWTGGWEVVFAGAAAWFGWQTIRGIRGQRAGGSRPGHPGQHVLACVAMLYMFLAATSGATAAAGHGGASTGAMAAGPARFPTLALLLAVALFGYVVWTADRLPGLAPVAAAARIPALAPAEVAAGASRSHGDSRTPDEDGAAPAGQGGGVPVSPRLSACCDIAMGVTMGYALILML